MTDIVIKKKNEVYVIAGAPHIHHELSIFSFEVPEAKFLKKSVQILMK